MVIRFTRRTSAMYVSTVYRPFQKITADFLKRRIKSQYYGRTLLSYLVLYRLNTERSKAARTLDIIFSFRKTEIKAVCKFCVNS